MTADELDISRFRFEPALSKCAGGFRGVGSSGRGFRTTGGGGPGSILAAHICKTIGSLLEEDGNDSSDVSLAGNICPYIRKSSVSGSPTHDQSEQDRQTSFVSNALSSVRPTRTPRLVRPSLPVRVSRQRMFLKYNWLRVEYG